MRLMILAFGFILLGGGLVGIGLVLRAKQASEDTTDDTIGASDERLSCYLERVGSDGGDTFPLEGDKVHVGRDDTNDLVITANVPGHETVADWHATLAWNEVDWGWVVHTIEREGVTAKTLVNGQPVDEEQTLHSGAIVAFGEVRYVYREVLNADKTATAGDP
jgi:hypothetical protein